MTPLARMTGFIVIVALIALAAPGASLASTQGALGGTCSNQSASALAQYCEDVPGSTTPNSGGPGSRPLGAALPHGVAARLASGAATRGLLTLPGATTGTGKGQVNSAVRSLASLAAARGSPFRSAARVSPVRSAASGSPPGNLSAGRDGIASTAATASVWPPILIVLALATLLVGATDAERRRRRRRSAG